MQRKNALRYHSITALIIDGVEKRLTDHEQEELPTWTRLVELACNPEFAAALPNDGTFADHTLAHSWVLTNSFLKCFRRRPDLTLKVLVLARRILHTHNQSSKAKQAIRFLLENSLLIKENGSYRELVDDDLQVLMQDTKTRYHHKHPISGEVTHKRSGKSTIKTVPIELLQDGEIAQLLSRPGFDVSVETVKKARRLVSK